MILSNKSILEEMGKGNIVIDPFIRKNLGGISYDVRLGENFYRQRTVGMPHVHLMYNQSHQEKRWGEPMCAKSLLEVCEEHKLDPSEIVGTDGIPLDEKVILFAPGENILGHTLEFIGPRGGDIMAELHSTSGIRRNQFTVCSDADTIQPGYFNKITVELQNHSTIQYAILVVGQTIGQVIFKRTEPMLPGSSYGNMGSYQQGSDIAEVKKNWNPSTMLPRSKYKVFE